MFLYGSASFWRSFLGRSKGLGAVQPGLNKRSLE
ncbi:hypothetical protein PH5382_01366 [Phaeobacter sp. CECT 5382]|nr:hypothetical protein PH5382_01366 [Phaeobacter sp. CECT 5382]